MESRIKVKKLKDPGSKREKDESPGEGGAIRMKRQVHGKKTSPP